MWEQKRVEYDYGSAVCVAGVAKFGCSEALEVDSMTRVTSPRLVAKGHGGRGRAMVGIETLIIRMRSGRIAWTKTGESYSVSQMGVGRKPAYNDRKVAKSVRLALFPDLFYKKMNKI